MSKIHHFIEVNTPLPESKVSHERWIDPSIELYPSDYVNSPIIIARNPKVVAINSAVEIDLTGQVCSDSVGHRMISGVGGQIDFIRGAAMSEGGKSVIAITSRTKNGSSRIVPALHEGAGVVLADELPTWELEFVSLLGHIVSNNRG